MYAIDKRRAAWQPASTGTLAAANDLAGTCFHGRCDGIYRLNSHTRPTGLAGPYLVGTESGWRSSPPFEGRPCATRWRARISGRPAELVVRRGFRDRNVINCDGS